MAPVAIGSMLVWLRPRFEADNPISGICRDGPIAVGHVRLELQGADANRWVWHMPVTGFGRDGIMTNGAEAARDEAKAAVEAAYAKLLAAPSG